MSAPSPAAVLKSIYTPSKWQSEFHHANYSHTLGAGSAGPGKSLALLFDPFYQILEEHRRCTERGHPHPLIPGTSTGHALHLRRKMKMLEETIQRSKRWFKLIDPGARFSEGNNCPMWTFSSGYRYEFGHCHDRWDWENYVGSEPTALYFDEIIQFEEQQVVQISARVRSSDPVLRKMLRIKSATNPVTRFDEKGGNTIHIENPDWVREWFVDPAPEGRKVLQRTFKMQDGSTGTRTLFYLPAKLYDNPDPDFRRDYEETLRGLPKIIRKAYLEGNWYISPGSFFGDEWDPEIHTCKPFKVPKSWRTFRSMDWGYKAYGCIHWWALDPEGTLYCVREYMFRLQYPDQVAKTVIEIEKSLGFIDKKAVRSTLTGPADTQIWEERGDQTPSKASEFHKAGVSWVPANKKSRAKNAMLLYERLADHADHTQTPGIVFFETCKEAIKFLPKVPRDKNNPEEPRDGGADHCYDSAAYGCAYASHGEIGIGSYPDDSDDPKERKPEANTGFGYGSAI